MRGNSPCPACRALSRSPCSVRVGRPVDGPPRCQSVTTSGTSLMPTQPSPSVISEKPGPEVAVEARTPVSAAPAAMVMAAISSSVCTTITAWSAPFSPPMR